MGTWQNDSGPSDVESFFIHNGELFAFTPTGDGTAGAYERTGAATWTYRKPAAASETWHVCVWQGRIWVADLSNVWYSSDASNWTLSWSVPNFESIRAMNGYGNYLYVVYHETAGAHEPIAHFARANTSLNWTDDCFTQYTHPGGTSEDLISHDIIEFGSYVYWALGETNVSPVYKIKRWTGSAWQDDPGSGSLGACFFLVHGSILYALDQVIDEVHTCINATWSQDWNPGVSLPGRLSVGVDGLLWTTTVTGGTLQCYKRSGGSWVAVHESDTDDGGGGAIAGVDEHPYYGGQSDIYRNTDSVPVSGRCTPSGGGSPPQAIAVDGDGDLLYIALYNTSGNPILVRGDLPLHYSHLGSKIFDPGAGDAINVKCTEFTGERVVISGYFGNNEQTELSEDGGDTLTGIDPGTWGANRAQPIALDPGDDDHIYLALDGNDDLVETEDVSSWGTLDAALPYDVSAMDVHDLDPGEIVIARTNAGAQLTQHSPNKGTTWTDITGALDITAGIAAVEII